MRSTRLRKRFGEMLPGFDPLVSFARLAVSAVVAVLTLCSPDPVSTNAGGGIETTNGFAATFQNPDGSPASFARVRIRPSDYLPGGSTIPKNCSIDTAADSAGSVRVHALPPRSYTVEVLGDSGLGVVFHETVLGHRDSIHSLGAIEIRPTGRVEGSISIRNIPLTATVTAKIYGLQRSATINSEGRFMFEDVAPQTYQIFIESDRDSVGNADIPFVTVEENRSTTIQPVNLPIDYRIDSLAVMKFLKDQEIEMTEWSKVVEQPINNRIRRLYLNDRGIRHLAPSIGNLDFLWRLDLSGNPLQELPPEIGTISPPELYLNRIPMDTIIPGFEHLTRISTLTLDSTGIKKLPDFSKNGVGILSLKQNGYTSIPAEVLQATQLSRLTMGENTITTLSGIGNLTNLEFIQFSGNRIDSIPDEIGKCTKLSEIRITNNVLVYISPKIALCPLIKSLWLYQNDIPALPDEITRLDRLKTLRLESNELTALPRAIGVLVNLQVLYLSNNPLAHLPTSILSLSDVMVQVRKCQLCTLTPEIAEWLDTHSRSEDWPGLQVECK